MNDLILFFGLVLVLEGMFYAGAPVFMKRSLENIRDLPVEILEAMGWAAVAFGLLLVWIARG